MPSGTRVLLAAACLLACVALALGTGVPDDTFDEPFDVVPDRAEQQQQLHHHEHRHTVVVDEDDDEFEGVTAPAPAARVVHVNTEQQQQQRAAYQDALPELKQGGNGGGEREAGATATVRAVPATVVDKSPLGLLRQWALEAGFVVVFAVLTVNYFIGRAANKRIADQVALMLSGPVRSNFSAWATAANTLVRQTSDSSFSFSATGRINCGGMFGRIELRKRQDLVGGVLLPALGVVSAAEDLLVCEVLLDEAMEPLVLAVVPRKEARAFAKEHRDVGQLARLVASPLDAGNVFVTFCDHDEAAAALLSGPVAATFARFAGSIRGLHISDQYTQFGEEKRILRLQVALTAANDIAELDAVLRMMFTLVDFIPRLALSRAQQARALSARAEFNAEAEKESAKKRQEAAQERKAEKDKAKQAAIAALSPEERERALEKIKRKEQKKRMAKGGKMSRVVM